LNLKHSKTEIIKAEKSFDLMKNCESIQEIENNWRDFLNHLEKIWNKSERECQSFKNKFQPWQGEFVRLRKKDPLLRYLKNARDADVHSIFEIVQKSNPINIITPTEGQEIAGDLTTKFELLNVTGINIISPLEGEIISGDVKLKFELIIEDKLDVINIENKEITYSPPESHLGNKINNSKDLFEIAELGLVFYKNYISQIESKFF
jgi:ethanolamine utilization microcompartment shell protein EutS